MIGRTRKHRGNSEPYDPDSAPPRDGGMIQAQAGPRDCITWIDIYLEVGGIARASLRGEQNKFPHEGPV